MTQNTIQLITLTADEGKVLTNGEIYSTQVYLGIYDSPENWHEISADEVPSEEENE
jgi:hypothetical protein